MTIPNHVLRSLKRDALEEIRIEEDQRHAEYLAQFPTPVDQLIDLAEVDQRIHDAREELEANQYQIEKYRAKIEKHRRANTAIRAELDDLHNRRRALERTQ